MNKMRSWNKAVSAAGAVLVCLLMASPLAQAAPAADGTLPDYVIRELSHLEETYRILDIAANEVWPGWNNYREFPFLLKYPNNLKVLVGHPNPPAPFEKMPGLKVENMEVYADFSEVNTARVEYPRMAGGGPQAFGKTRDGRNVTTVMMDFMSTDILKKGGYGIVRMPFCVELQILCYIHELFHCFQNDHINIDKVGNLVLNPVADFDLYSTIEGYALLKAYEAKTPETARAFIKDFLAARYIKRTACMPEQQQKQESGDDLLEGTAVYSSVRTTEILARGYTTKQDLSKDKYYKGFKNTREILAAQLQQLKDSSEAVYDCKGKCYDYGCFQALLLRRYSPDWQADFSKKPMTLDKALAKLVGFDPKDTVDIARHEKRFREIYGFDKIKARTSEAIAKRDDAYHALMGRKGLSYVINLKELGVYADQIFPEVPQYKLGLITLCMEGLPAVKNEQFDLGRIAVPVEVNMLHHLKAVDTNPKAGAKPYTVKGRTADGATYENAVITTPLFTLKAPLVRIEESKDRVKFVILPVIRK